MRAILFVIFVLSAAGCSHYTPAEITSISQSYINSWQSPESMTVSEENQIAFLRSYLAETKKPLGEALEHPSYSVRMWAAYVIGQIGPVARMMESQLTERLQSEQNRVVRIYLYEAVQKTELGTPALIALLRQRFEALDDSPSGQDYSNRRWDISDADEKIHLAATLCVLEKGPACGEYRTYLLNWLRNPTSELTSHEWAQLWDRRRETILVLPSVPGASAAIPLLEELQSGHSAPSWFYFTTTDVRNSLK